MDFKKIEGAGISMVDLLAMPDGEAIEFDPPRLGDDLYRPEKFISLIHGNMP